MEEISWFNNFVACIPTTGEEYIIFKFNDSNIKYDLVKDKFVETHSWNSLSPIGQFLLRDWVSLHKQQVLKQILLKDYSKIHERNTL